MPNEITALSYQIMLPEMDRTRIHGFGDTTNYAC